MSRAFDYNIVFFKSGTIECATHFIDDGRMVLARVVQEIAREGGMNRDRAHCTDRYFDVKDLVQQY